MDFVKYSKYFYNFSLVHFFQYLVLSEFSDFQFSERERSRKMKTATDVNLVAVETEFNRDQIQKIPPLKGVM